MRRIILSFTALILVLASCSEEIELQSARSKTKFLAVEGILTNMEDTYQVINLTESVKYFTGNRSVAAPTVSGASVAVFDGEDWVEFTEYPTWAKGSYLSPKGFYGEPGKTYTLRIERYDAHKELHVYEAKATMPEPGCAVDAIDYMFSGSTLDSSYTIGLWGRDLPHRDNLMAMTSVNGYQYPIDKSFGLDDKYYNGQYLEGYPVSIIVPTWERYNAGELYAKPFEEGDEISLSVYTLSDDFYDFYMQFYYNMQAAALPLIASQPANVMTNISGDNVVGYFTAAPVQVVSCIVDDPYRTEFKYEHKDYDVQY